MIEPDEIINMSQELKVHESNVQRDYIFGWTLAGIYAASDLGNHLVLKGGNCLRKAYFEAARYSPDLDFATTGELSPAYLASELNQVCDFTQANTGVEFSKDRTRVEEKKGADSSNHVLEARIYFRDFFGEESEVILSVRMDVTEFEKIFLPVQTRHLIHPYSDHSLCIAPLRCLKLEEMLAGKLKCLLQRRHVADLFDFVNAVFVTPSLEINQAEVVATFLKMTIFASGPGIVKDLFVNLPFQILQSLWDKYVVCPSGAMIHFDNAVERFRATVESMFGSFPAAHGEFAFFPSHMRNPIMDAGYNLTLLRIMYDGTEREVEPYSLKYKIRRDGVAREYLYVYDRTGGRSSGPSIKSLVHPNIGSITNTDIQFEPRFDVELSKAGQYFKEAFFHGSPGPRISRTLTSARYVIECPLCTKHFYRNEYDTKLNPHKDQYGNRCLGRIGYLV